MTKFPDDLAPFGGDDAPVPSERASAHTASEHDWQQLIDYLAGEGTPSDRHAIEQRLLTDHSFATFAAPAITVWRTTLPTPTRDTAAGWEAVKRKGELRRASHTPPSIAAALPERATPAANAPSHRWRSPKGWLSIAVALIVLVVVGRPVYLAMRYPIHYYKSGAADSTVTLADGSTVTLAPHSYLGTARGFLTENRTVYLFGHARFALAPNPRLPFIVSTAGIGARALGTTFSLHADTALSIRIDVTAGKVALEASDGQGRWHTLQVLTAGDAVQIPRLEAWLVRAGYDLAGAGVPFIDAMRIGENLRRAALRAGAAQAARHLR